MSGAAPLIEARGLVRHFRVGGGPFSRAGAVRAVDGVDLAVRAGETFAIVGESGCGKSTLARLLARLIEPSAGEVLFGGEGPPAGAASMRAFRRQMQFVFQDPFASLNPRMSVGALIAEPLELHLPGLGRAGRRARMAELLSLVGLRPEHACRWPHEFSGGQRQRIGIARALACGPRAVVADEPVSALDVSVQAQVVNLLGDLRRDLGLTLVIVAHDLGVIRHMSDRVAVMYLGRIVETGEADAVFAAPRHPYTRALLAAIPGEGAGAAPLAGEMPSPLAPPPGCRFHTRCPHAQGACLTVDPALEGGAHAVACHRWREIGPAAPPPAPRARSPGAAARFALWEGASAGARVIHEPAPPGAQAQPAALAAANGEDAT